MDQYFKLKLINGIVKQVYIDGRVGSVYSFNYNDLSKSIKLIDESNSNSIYILIIDRESIYIGQSINGAKRLVKHHKIDKIFSDENDHNIDVYMFRFDNLSPNRNILDKIERKLIEISKVCSFNPLNSALGIESKLNEEDEQTIGEIFPTLLRLLSASGVNLYDTENKNTQEINLDSPKSHVDVIVEEFFIELSDGTKTSIFETNNGWLIKKGSKVEAYKIVANEKRTSGYLIYDTYKNSYDENGILNIDVRWKTVSPIAAFAKGNKSTNGWKAIRNKDGKTPDELYRQTDI